ncbi:MAG: YicC family protein [Lewinellaceae bacterium]|nr:YicC family protein [Lewinellaceae bacterium]
MTGYGRATNTVGEKTINVEVRSLNAKSTDLKMRLPGDFKEKELELRKIITDHAERGKIDLYLDVQNADGAAAVNINEGLFRGYHRELTKLGNELNLPTDDLLLAILRIPNVVSMPSGDIDDNVWDAICKTVGEALDQLKGFRRQEGMALESDLRARVAHIMNNLVEVEPFEKGRIVRMRERIHNNLEEFLGRENVDKNRFEQEILFYLEKMDINEEKVRLEQHCKYFLEQIDNKELSGGRTMAFISQEMGREINTLGAKAYDADIQKLVVQMKDDLEKIKEQLANVL